MIKGQKWQNESENYAYFCAQILISRSLILRGMPAKGVAVVTGASYGLGASVAKKIKNLNLNLNLNLGASIAKQLACKVLKYEVVLVARCLN